MTKIGRHCVIADDVEFGSNVTVKDHVNLESGTKIGDNTIFDHYSCSRGNNSIGSNVTVKPRVTIAKHVTVEDNVFISPNVMTAYVTAKRGSRGGTVIGEGTFIGTAALIGAGVHIGRHCVVGAHAFLNHASLGGRCYVGTLTNIGGQGLWVKRGRDGALRKIHATAEVKIGDDVYVGDGAMVQRGFERDTTIDDGTRIGPYALVGHDSQIGKHCIIVGRAWLCGFTVMEDRSRVSPSIVKQRLTIGHDSFVGIGSLVTHDVPPCSTVAGMPAMPIEQLKALRKAMKREV